MTNETPQEKLPTSAIELAQAFAAELPQALLDRLERLVAQVSEREARRGYKAGRFDALPAHCACWDCRTRASKVEEAFIESWRTGRGEALRQASIKRSSNTTEGETVEVYRPQDPTEEACNPQVERPPQVNDGH